MTRLDFRKILSGDVKEFVLMSSTDLFYDNREALDCGFATRELQAALRAWIKANGFEIMSYWPERMQERFDLFLTANAHLGRTLDDYVDWIERAADPADDRRIVVSGWGSAFRILAGRREILPAPGGRPLYDTWLNRYIELVQHRSMPLNDLADSISKEWSCHPDERQLKFNVEIKGDWDADIYFNCILEDEIDVRNTLLAMPRRKFFLDFVKLYDQTSTKNEKASFHAAVRQIANEFSLLPDSELIRPLEDVLLN